MIIVVNKKTCYYIHFLLQCVYSQVAISLWWAVEYSGDMGIHGAVDHARHPVEATAVSYRTA